MHQVRSNSVPVIKLMLAIMLMQSLFMAIESGMQVTSPFDDAGHHATTHTADDQHADSGLATSANYGEDSCDHCCQCHGHCTHFAAAGAPLEPFALDRKSQASPEPPQQLSAVPFCLYRPPIVA